MSKKHVTNERILELFGSLKQKKDLSQISLKEYQPNLPVLQTWLNTILLGPDINISDGTTWRDGMVLIEFLEIIMHTSLSGHLETPLRIFDKLINLEIVLSVLRHPSVGVDDSALTVEGIYHGDLRMVLLLIIRVLEKFPDGGKKKKKKRGGYLPIEPSSDALNALSVIAEQIEKKPNATPDNGDDTSSESDAQLDVVVNSVAARSPSPDGLGKDKKRRVRRRFSDNLTNNGGTRERKKSKSTLRVSDGRSSSPLKSSSALASSVGPNVKLFRVFLNDDLKKTVILEPATPLVNILSKIAIARDALLEDFTVTYRDGSPIQDLYTLLGDLAANEINFIESEKKMVHRQRVQREKESVERAKTKASFSRAKKPHRLQSLLSAFNQGSMVTPASIILWDKLVRMLLSSAEDCEWFYEHAGFGHLCESLGHFLHRLLMNPEDPSEQDRSLLQVCLYTVHAFARTETPTIKNVYPISLLFSCLQFTDANYTLLLLDLFTKFLVNDENVSFILKGVMSITPTSPEMKKLIKEFIEGRGEESEPLQSQFIHYMLSLLLSASTYLEEQSLVALFWDCGCTYDALVALANESSKSLQEQIESYFDEAEMFPGYIPFAPEKLLVDELQADSLPVSKMAATAALGSFVNRLDQFKSVTLTVPKPPTPTSSSTPSVPESVEPAASPYPTRPERAHERERSSDKRVQLKRIGSVGGIGATNKKLVSTTSSSSSGNPIPALPLSNATSDTPPNPSTSDSVAKKNSAVKFSLPETGLKPAPSLLPKQRKKMRKKPLVPLSRGTLTVAHTGMNELKKFQRLRLSGLAADVGRSFTEIRKFLTLLKDKMGPTTDSVAFYKCLGSYIGVPKASFSDLESLGTNPLGSHNVEGFIAHIKKTNRRVWKWVHGVHAFSVGPDVVKKVELIHTHFLFYNKATTVVAAAVAFRSDESTPLISGGDPTKAKVTPEPEAASSTPLLVPPSELTPKSFSKRPVPELSPVQVSASTTPSRAIEALLGDFDGLLEFLNAMWKFSDGIIDNEIEQRTARGVELSEDWIYLLSQRILEIEEAEALSVSYSRRIQFFSVWHVFLDATAAHQGQMDAMQSFKLGGMNFESSKTLASLKFRSDNRSMESLNYIPAAASAKKKVRKKSDATKKGAGQL